MKVAGMVCARLGSNRVKAKNLRLLNGKPLIYYALSALKECKNFDDIYVNSESDLIGKVGERYGVKFYKRPEHLATSEARYDQYVADFMNAHTEYDVVAIVNPTSPFIDSGTLDRAVDYFFAHKLDTLLACENVRTHCFYEGMPINFSTEGLHPRSQDLTPVKALNFAISIWRSETFLESYNANGYGVYSGKMDFFPLGGLETIDIDWEEDFALAEFIMRAMEHKGFGSPGYDEVLSELIKSGEEFQN